MNQSYEQDDTYPSEAATYDKENNELLREVIDCKQVLEDFEYRVLRKKIKVFDTKTNTEGWVDVAKGAKPIINEIGISEIMARLIPIVNKEVKMSYKLDEEIYKDMFYFDMSFTEMIAKRSGLWELDIEAAKSIKDAAVELAWATLASSRDGFTAINLRSQYNRQDIRRSDEASGSQRTFMGLPIGSKK